MIKATLTNTMVKLLSRIDQNRFTIEATNIPQMTINRLRKMSKKKSSYASNKIEGNPLTESQAEAVIESDPHGHFLKPEQEIRNYYLALNLLEDEAKKKTPFSKDLLLQVQALVEKGASKEKIGLRGAMPPGFLFAVYDSTTGMAEYIPPEHTEILDLLDELITYVNTTDDHPLIVAAIVHYQLVTIHPFEDGNGRTARLMSGYIMDTRGYAFGGIGSLEEYFAYNPEEYYASLQMGLPALYYSGRENPPHPEIWIEYFFRMVALYSDRACEIAKGKDETGLAGLSYLNKGEKELLCYLLKEGVYAFAPIGLSKKMGITSKTVSNRCLRLTQYGFLVPVIAKTRIRSYELSEFAKTYKKKILKLA